jgi:arylformamidase
MSEENGITSRLDGTPDSEWIDISIPVRDAMVHMPKDPAARIYRIYDADKGDIGTMYGMDITSHAGTHIDAPRHFFRDGKTIDEMPLDATMGLARVIEINDTESIKPEELNAHNIQPGERLLFKTINSLKAYETDELFKDYVCFTPASAQFLADKRVRAVGLDYIAAGSNKNDEDLIKVHQILEIVGIWIIEGLNLSAVQAGQYDLICLPIKLEGGDAGLTRAIVRRISK